jgi:hypothetical protein
LRIASDINLAGYGSGDKGVPVLLQLINLVTLNKGVPVLLQLINLVTLIGPGFS